MLLWGFLWGFLVSFLGAWGAYYKQALSGSGMVGAVLVGTLIAGFGGWLWFVILLTFFGTASLWSSYRRQDKRAVDQDFAKTGRRDLGQVLANGGLGALLAILSARLGHPSFLFVGYIGVMATVTADAWATELGVLTTGTTRSILTGQRVTQGVSGGVSLEGTLAGASGAILIGLVAAVGQYLSGPIGITFGMLLLAGTLGGLIGCIIDSILGETLQLRYQCRICGRTTEKLKHCHQLTIRSGGWGWLNNDMVNLLSSMVGGMVAIAVILWK